MGAFITNLGWVPSAWRRRLGLVCKEGATEGILRRDQKDPCYRKISLEAVCWVDWSGQTQTWRHLFRDCLVQHLHFISEETGAGGINHTPKATSWQTHGRIRIQDRWLRLGMTDQQQLDLVQ